MIDQAHHDGWQLPSHIGDARGLYNPMQFVVRLHDSLHAELAEVPVGVGMRTVTSQQALALSTYFHEKIHWWQHVGSTLGLFLSLAYPAQAHVNYKRLKTILRDVGAVKSLLDLDITNARRLKKESRQILNIILNNWHDIEFCRLMAIAPDRASEVIAHPYFDSIGHSYEITWGNVILLIREALDPEHGFVRGPEDWEEPFRELRENGVEDYYYGSSPLRLSSVGARLIFEGQARLSQIQSLYFASPGSNWDLFDSLGMLGEDYTTAFLTFLKILNLPWPSSPGSSEVALFLAICDAAMNPTEGFPFPISDFERFRANLDPGLRFASLCQAAAELKGLASIVSNFSRDEYQEITESLSRKLGWRSPLEVSATVCDWAQYPSFQALESENATFAFANRDLPVRVFVGRYLEFQKDKLQFPELLVWPGAFTGGREPALPMNTIIDVFARQEPLFVDVAGGEVRPTLLVGREYDAIYQMFNTFHAYSASYQLVRQWHVTSGPFNLDFGWLGPSGRTEESARWAANNFATTFGRSINEFEILRPVPLLS